MKCYICNNNLEPETEWLFSCKKSCGFSKTSMNYFYLTGNTNESLMISLNNKVYLNIFSCKDFNEKTVRDFTRKYFEGEVVGYKVILRK